MDNWGGGFVVLGTKGEGDEYEIEARQASRARVFGWRSVLQGGEKERRAEPHVRASYTEFVGELWR